MHTADTNRRHAACTRQQPASHTHRYGVSKGDWQHLSQVSRCGGEPASGPSIKISCLLQYISLSLRVLCDRGTAVCLALSPKGTSRQLVYWQYWHMGMAFWGQAGTHLSQVSRCGGVPASESAYQR